MTLSQLKNAGITAARGTEEQRLLKIWKDISLVDVYSAVECLGKSGQLLAFMTSQSRLSYRQEHSQRLDDRLWLAQAARS